MSGESELLRQRLEEVQVEMESVRRERATERAELDELRQGAAKQATREASEAEAKEPIDGRSEPALQQQRVQVQQAEQVYRNHTGMSLIMSQNGMRVPKFIDGQTLHLWSSRFQAFLTARGLIGTICLLYTSPSPRDQRGSRMPSSA